MERDGIRFLDDLREQIVTSAAEEALAPEQAPKHTRPIDSLRGRLRFRIAVAAVAAVVIGAATLGAVMSGTGKEPTSPVPSSGGGSALQGNQMTEPLDDPSVQGTSLDSALALIGKSVPLPLSKPSEVAKVLFDQSAGAPRFSLAIRYVSGVKLFVHPGESNLAGTLATLKEGVTAAPFSDGQQHIKMTTVAGEDVLAITGGTQTGLASDSRVPTSVTWNQDGYTYIMYSPVTDVSVQATDAALSDLLTLVAGTK